MGSCCSTTYIWGETVLIEFWAKMFVCQSSHVQQQFVSEISQITTYALESWCSQIGYITLRSRLRRESLGFIFVG